MVSAIYSFEQKPKFKLGRYRESPTKEDRELPFDILEAEDIKRVVGAASEIAIMFFFQNLIYTFARIILDGPIGTRMTMCSNNREKILSRIYEDDNNFIAEKLRPAMRFNLKEKKNGKIKMNGQKRISGKIEKKELFKNLENQWTLILPWKEKQI